MLRAFPGRTLRATAAAAEAVDRVVHTYTRTRPAAIHHVSLIYGCTTQTYLHHYKCISIINLRCNPGGATQRLGEVEERRSGGGRHTRAIIEHIPRTQRRRRGRARESRMRLCVHARPPLIIKQCRAVVEVGGHDMRQKRTQFTHMQTHAHPDSVSLLPALCRTFSHSGSRLWCNVLN